MNNEYVSNNKVGLSAIIFIMYSLYYISGYTSPLHNYVIVALFFLWNLFAFVEDRNAYSYAIGNKCFAWLLLYIIYYFFSSFLVADLVYTLEYVVIFMCLYGTIIQYKYYYYRNNIKEITQIVFMLTLGFVIFAIIAIGFYIINPSAARILAANYYAFDTIAIGGGYSIAFGSSIFAVYLFEILLRKKYISKKASLTALVLFILFEILLIKTESTTTLIANLFGILIGVIVKGYVDNKGKKGNIIIISAVLIVIFCIIVLNINEIGSYITDITSNGTENVLIRRFNRIGQKMKYEGVQSGYTNYVDERFGTISTSWNTFLQHPFWGVGYKCGNIFSLLEDYGVGTHSELVDILAQFGIFGFVFWGMFILTSVRCQNNKLRCKGWKIALIIMLIFNPFRAFHGYVVIFFLIPMIEYLIEKNNYMVEENFYEDR